MKTNRPPPDYIRWNLPEDAKARLVTGAINDIQFSRDGTRLAVASSIGIWIYDGQTGEELDLLLGHRGPVFSIAYAPNHPFLASGGKDNTVRLWNVEQGVLCKTLQINERDSLGVYNVVFQDDGSILASGGFYGLDLDDGGYSKFLWIMEFDADSWLIDWVLNSWTIEDHVPITVDKRLYPESSIKSVAFSDDGACIASGSVDGTLRLWDTKSCALLKTLKTNHTFIPGQSEAVESIAFCGDGHILASGGCGTVRLWDMERGEPLQIPMSLDFSGGPYSMCFSPDRRILARSNASAHHISLSDVTTGKLLKTLPYTVNDDHITSFAFSPDGRILASGSQDGTVLLWDVNITTDTSTPTTGSMPQSVAALDIATRGNSLIQTEKNSESQNRESHIRRICTERSITTLFHFTRIENLCPILQEGLLGRSILETWEQQPLFNDSDRADGYKEAVCLSISFPNYKMFWPIRREIEKTEGVKDFQWIVLLLDAKVLWELDCAFCYTNAASGVVKSLLSKEQIDEQKRPEALKNMFATDYYDSIRKIRINRQNLQIPDNYTTDPQAEILVFDPIPTRYIEEIHFYEEIAREEWLSNTQEVYSQTFHSSREYFRGRHDWQFWKKETS